MRSAWFWDLSKLSRLSLAVVAYADELYSKLGLTVPDSLSWVSAHQSSMLSQSAYAQSSAFVSLSPLMGNVWLPRVSFVKLYWYNDCLPPYMFYTGYQLFGLRLVSDTLSCDPMSLSELSSFIVSVLLRFGVTYIFIVIRSVGCLFACYYITILVEGWCNSLNVLVIQLFDKSAKLLIIPFKI